MESNYILTVAGSKGGVGKTTTSINLGACFANAGYARVVVEADLAMANLVDFVSVGVDISASETLHDLLAGDIPVTEAVYDVDENLAVVPSGTNLDRYGNIDVERAETDVRGLVLSKSGTGASPGAGRIADFLDLDLLGHVPEDDAVPHSQDHGVPVVEYAPRSGPAIAYEKIASQLVDTVDVSSDESSQSEGPTETPVGETGRESSVPDTDTGAGAARTAGTAPGSGSAVGTAERTARQSVKGRGRVRVRDGAGEAGRGGIETTDPATEPDPTADDDGEVHASPDDARPPSDSIKGAGEDSGQSDSSGSVEEEDTGRETPDESIVERIRSTVGL